MPEHLPPTPRGYQRLPVPANEQGFVNLLTCDRCGALVLMTGTHNQWHRDRGRDR